MLPVLAVRGATARNGPSLHPRTSSSSTPRGSRHPMSPTWRLHVGRHLSSDPALTQRFCQQHLESDYLWTFPRHAAFSVAGSLGTSFAVFPPLLSLSLLRFAPFEPLCEEGRTVLQTQLASDSLWPLRDALPHRNMVCKWWLHPQTCPKAFQTRVGQCGFLPRCV